MADPVIRQFTIENTVDFIVLGSDGLFQKQSSKSISCDIYTLALKYIENEKDFEEFLMDLPIFLIRVAIKADSMDSISVIVLFFDTFYQAFVEKDVNKFNSGKKTLEGDFLENRKELYGEQVEKEITKKEELSVMEKPVFSKKTKLKTQSIFCCCRKKKKTVIYEQV